MSPLSTGNLSKVLQDAVQFVRQKAPADFKPELALVLGSGLSGLSKMVRSLAAFPYGQIPGFVSTKVSGHRGEFIAGEYYEKKVLVLSGRIHFYEGTSMAQATFPVRLVRSLGAKTIILTSAVGAINRKFRAGEVVIVKDHINFMGENPLRGEHDPSFGERFPDLTECYSKRLQALAWKLAKTNKIPVHSGNYFALSGPSYETPAEIRAFRKLGGDVVGMSLVPEAIVARQAGCEVLGLCYISNLAAGVSKSKLDHQEVLQMGQAAGKKLSKLIGEIVKKL